MGNINIPGRITSVSKEKIICGADEIIDDVIGNKQNVLNARFKAITDQQQIALNGGTVEIANTGESIISGNGAIPTSNAIAEKFSTFEEKVLIGTIRISEVNSDLSIENIDVDNNAQIDVIYNNNASTEVIVTILNTNFKTPDGNDIILTIPVGGYTEASYLKINNIIYVRGC